MKNKKEILLFDKEIFVSTISCFHPFGHSAVYPKGYALKSVVWFVVICFMAENFTKFI